MRESRKFSSSQQGMTTVLLLLSQTIILLHFKLRPIANFRVSKSQRPQYNAKIGECQKAMKTFVKCFVKGR